MIKVDRGLLFITLLALIWGSSFLWIKFALDGFSPIQITFGRMFLGAAVLFIIVLVRREKMPRSVKIWLHLGVAALFANAVPYALFALAETVVPSSIAGVLNATTPLWTVLLALAVREHHRLGGWQVSGFVLGFVGALVIFSPWQNTDASLIGMLECLGAAVSYALSFIYMGRYLAKEKLSSVSLSACQLLVATCWLVIALPFDPHHGFSADSRSIVALFMLGVFGTGIAYVINYAIIRREGPARASTVTYLIPVVSVILGVLVRSEPVTVSLFVGTIVILIGVAMTRVRKKVS